MFHGSKRLFHTWGTVPPIWVPLSICITPRALNVKMLHVKIKSPLFICCCCRCCWLLLLLLLSEACFQDVDKMILYCNSSFKIRYPVVKKKGGNARKAFGRYGFYNSKPMVREVGTINSPFEGASVSSKEQLILHLP